MRAKEGSDSSYLILIQVQSAGFDAGNHAQITVNDHAVQIAANEHDTLRGLHVVILSPSTEEVEWASAFDTYKSSRYLDDFLDLQVQEQAPEGSIVVVACKDDCVTNLSEKAKNWFASLGSKEIWNLQYR